jgi:hypothetical protein
MHEDSAKSNVTKLRVRCATCGGAFGLIRHRLGRKQFCSKQCLEHHHADGKYDPLNLIAFFRSK